MNIVKNAAKFADFKHGKTMYLICSDGTIDRIFILGRPKSERTSSTRKQLFRIRFFNQRRAYKNEAYLSDEGVPGHAYDDRIPQIYLNRKSAEKAAAHLFRIEQEKAIKGSDVDHYDYFDPDFGYADYHDHHYDPEEEIRRAEVIMQAVLSTATKKAYIWDIPRKYESDHPEVLVMVGGVTYLGYAIDSRRIRIEYSTTDGETEENLMFLLRGSDQVWRSFGNEECSMLDWLSENNGLDGKMISVLLNNALNQKVLFNDLTSKEFFDLINQIKERTEEKAVIPEVSES